MYSIASWNQRQATVDGMARTTNCVEGWHYSLQSLFNRKHPNMVKFLDGMQKDMNKQKMSLMQFTIGNVAPVKNVYTNLRAKAQRVVENYDKVDLMTYLKPIVQLSFGI